MARALVTMWERGRGHQVRVEVLGGILYCDEPVLLLMGGRWDAPFLWLYCSVIRISSHSSRNQSDLEWMPKEAQPTMPSMNHAAILEITLTSENEEGLDTTHMACVKEKEGRKV